MKYPNATNIELESEYIEWLSMMFIRFYCFLMIPIGIVGNLLSLIVFTRHSLRSNPCVMYFLSATIFAFLGSCFILPMRLIQSGYIGIDPTTNSNFMCKIIWFLLYSIRSLSYWFIVLACIDRYLCSSPSISKRAWSSTNVAYRVIPLTIFIGFLVYIHIPINFKIVIVPITQKLVCHAVGPPGSYRKISSIYNLFIFGLFPPLCMLISGILTLRNIDKRKGYNKILLKKLKISRMKTSEKQILRMLLAQVLVYSVNGLTFSIGILIISMKSNKQKSLLQIAQEKLIISVVGMLSNTGPSLSFYLFTLSSQLFRKELKIILNSIIENRIQFNDDYTPTASIDYTNKQQIDRS